MTISSGDAAGSVYKLNNSAQFDADSYTWGTACGVRPVIEISKQYL